MVAIQGLQKLLLTGVACLAVFFCSHAFSQDEIVLRGSSRFDLRVQPFVGDSGRAASSELKQILHNSGYFNTDSSSPAGFSVQGETAGSRIEATLKGPQGQEVFARSYASRSFQDNLARLGDDIIFAVTGVPGISSSQIVFVGRQGGRKEIYVCAYDGSNVRRLTNDGAISVSPTISPDRSWVAYTSYQSGYPDIFTIDLTNGTRRRIINAPGTNGGAVISPDGRTIALTMSFSGNKELYTVTRTGGSPRVLTRTSGGESSPTWSPDGREIIYSSDQTGQPQLYRISASGGQGTKLNVGYGFCTEPSWSPNGQRLAFNARSDGRMVVVIHEFQTGRSRVLRAGEDPSWAPDSRHLAFTSGGSLFRADVDGGASIRIASGVAEITEPNWSR